MCSGHLLVMGSQGVLIRSAGLSGIFCWSLSYMAGQHLAHYLLSLGTSGLLLRDCSALGMLLGTGALSQVCCMHCSRGPVSQCGVPGGTCEIFASAYFSVTAAKVILIISGLFWSWKGWKLLQSCFLVLKILNYCWLLLIFVISVSSKFSFSSNFHFCDLVIHSLSLQLPPCINIMFIFTSIAELIIITLRLQLY